MSSKKHSKKQNINQYKTINRFLERNNLQDKTFQITFYIYLFIFSEENPDIEKNYKKADHFKYKVDVVESCFYIFVNLYSQLRKLSEISISVLMT